MSEYNTYIPEDKDLKGRPALRPGQEQVNKIFNDLLKSRQYWVVHFHEHFNPEPFLEYVYNHYLIRSSDDTDAVGFRFDKPGENGIRFVICYKKSLVSALQLNQALAYCYDPPYDRSRFDEEHDIAYIGLYEDKSFTDSPLAKDIKRAKD